MQREITLSEYKFLKTLPRNKAYMKYEKIRKKNKKFSEDTFYRVAQDLYYIQYVNGDLKGVGLRVTDEGIEASKSYKTKNIKKWYKSTDLWIKIIGVLIALLGLLKLFLG